jgi:hypothetical protein
VTLSQRLKRLASLLAVAAIVLVCQGASPSCPQSPVSLSERSLAHCDGDPAPWLHLAANSEQRQPVYVGMTPREIAMGIAPVDRGALSLFRSLKECGERQAREIRKELSARWNLSGEDLILEAWPVRDDWGQLTWAFARWKREHGSWQWLDRELVRPHGLTERAPVLPLRLDPRNPQDHRTIFDEVLTRDSLYDKPVCGDCIWADERDPNTIFAAWVMPEDTPGISPLASSGPPGKVCYVLPRPVRWNGQPHSFSVRVSEQEVTWPPSILWKDVDLPREQPERVEARVRSWPPDFDERLREDTEIFSGEREAVFPKTGKRVRFLRKNNIDPENQLADVVGYLEERYAVLGIRTIRQDFLWRGAIQTNLLAIIPGEEEDGKPVILADHIDTAFCEDIFEKTRDRVSSPGADDNGLATAVLLRAAEMTGAARPRLPIWLVHLTGEEYPADDLGARHFVSQLLKTKTDITALVLMDLIGFREKDDLVFQVNAGESENSLRIAERVWAKARRLTRYFPVLRTRFDEKSYLYNTDGLIFSDAGYPVVHISEHVNKLENIDRDGYHHSTDTTAKIDWEYATAIGKIAIETVMELSDGCRHSSAEANAPFTILLTLSGTLVPVILSGYAHRGRSSRPSAATSLSLRN